MLVTLMSTQSLDQNKAGIEPKQQDRNTIHKMLDITQSKQTMKRGTYNTNSNNNSHDQIYASTTKTQPGTTIETLIMVQNPAGIYVNSARTVISPADQELKMPHRADLDFIYYLLTSSSHSPADRQICQYKNTHSPEVSSGKQSTTRNHVGHC